VKLQFEDIQQQKKVVDDENKILLAEQNGVKKQMDDFDRLVKAAIVRAVRCNLQRCLHVPLTGKSY
jgi:hypothetical protein